MTKSILVPTALASPGFPWLPLASPGFPWLPLASPGFLPRARVGAGGRAYR